MAIDLTLPVEERTQIIVNPNEYINNSTINRGNSRLLTNDKQLRDWIENVSGAIYNLQEAIGTILGMGVGTGIIATTGAIIFGAFNADRIATYYNTSTGPSGLIKDSGYTVNDVIYATNTRVQVSTGLTPGASQLALTPADNGKVFIDESQSTFQYNLPTVSAGIFYTFIKATSATLNVYSSNNKIADSSVGGSISNATSSENYATLRLLGYIGSTGTSGWVIEGAHGTWTTS